MNKKIIPAVMLAFLAGGTACTDHPEQEAVDKLGIPVDVHQNREYSYTDKKSGFWYGTSHQDSLFYWAGWNIEKKRILPDYILTVDSKILNRKEASCTVYPHKLVRQWKEAEETFYLTDNRPVIYIRVNAPAADSIALSLPESPLTVAEGITAQGMLFRPQEAPEKRILLTPADDSPFSKTANGIRVPARCSGFLLICADSVSCSRLKSDFLSEGETWLHERKERMNRLLTDNNPFRSNLPELNKALDWLTLTTDELITEQQGKGIYAGLPWFNEYWGRDMFISIPGACYVSGQFEVARQILLDFARLQDTAPESPTYGRIPNVAKPDGVYYNTTDGTPRFVIEALNLMRYTGDTTLVSELYPAVKRSIEGALMRYTDDKGYLTHADADTWMDVKRNGIPGSPRGNRANDIQALWYGQLRSGAEMATLMHDDEAAAQWNRLADRLKQQFEHDFCNKEQVYLYDHLNTDGSPDQQFRPNQLYCLDLLSDTDFCQQVTRRVWKELVYPWGVASLAQWDPQFHPQHENWHYYHKDDAYHNGTVWLWNNGIAMQRMLEYGQTETAWKLFANMNRQALYEGAIGSLSENADAHPRAGQTWAGRSGTFLQAWSNAEHLRVWYQYFLGIRPDLLQGTIVVDPRIPQEITELETTVKLGKGRLHYSYRNGQVTVQPEGISARIILNEPHSQPDSVWQDTGFCMPQPLDSYPCFATYHEPPLTY